MVLGGHIYFHAGCPDSEAGDVSEVRRKYTPISEIHQKGNVDFVIKIYRAGVHPQFPNGGRMTQYLEKMEVGQYLKMSGPVSKKEYKGNNKWSLFGEKVVKTHVGCVAGGSGITPFFQLIQEVVKFKDSLKISLIYGNRSEKDILMKEELENLQKEYPENIKIHYIIDKPDNPSEWKYDTGYITKEILDKHLPPAGEDTFIFTVGPKPMKNLVKELCKEYKVV